jgi:hypothetical protein
MLLPGNQMVCPKVRGSYAIANNAMKGEICRVKFTSLHFYPAFKMKIEMLSFHRLFTVGTPHGHIRYIINCAHLFLFCIKLKRKNQAL